jgi:Cytochrome b5-like Heme/Steroid binding domain
MIVTG